MVGMEAYHKRRTCGECPADLVGSIGRSVITDNHFIRQTGLFSDALQLLLQIHLSVVRGHGNGNLHLGPLNICTQSSAVDWDLSRLFLKQRIKASPSHSLFSRASILSAAWRTRNLRRAESGFGYS